MQSHVYKRNTRVNCCKHTQTEHIWFPQQCLAMFDSGLDSQQQEMRQQRSCVIKICHHHIGKVRREKEQSLVYLIGCIFCNILGGLLLTCQPLVQIRVFLVEDNLNCCSMLSLSWGICFSAQMPTSRSISKNPRCLLLYSSLVTSTFLRNSGSC